jgi:fatty acid desaturase
VLGVASIQLVMIAHDGMHGSLRLPRWTHVVLGRALSTYSLVPYHYLRHSHLEHHRRAGLIDGDPEILHPTRVAAADRWELRLVAHLARWPIAPLVFFPILQVVGFARFMLRTPATATARTARRESAIDVLCGVAFWGALIVFLPGPKLLLLALRGLVVPMAIGLSISHLAAFPLHTGMMGISLADQPLRSRAFLLSRTFESNALVRFLVGNVSFHVEHHLWPSLDRWQLAHRGLHEVQRMRALAAQLGVPYLRHRSYLSWYRRWLVSRDIYNSIGDEAALAAANVRYQGI